MNTLEHDLLQVQRDLTTALENVKTSNDLEHVHTLFLSRSGRIAALMARLKEASLEEKKVIGPQLNRLKQTAEQQCKELNERFEQAALTHQLTREKNFDVTAYRTQALRGSLHLYTQVIERLEDIFISMGYTPADGPEVETDFYNFTALNIPTDHPARDAHDTFWLTMPGMLLRTHTSSVQIRTLQQSALPLAIFAPGRVYRAEATDASHDFMFTQVEGLFVDTDVSMAHVLATVQTFLRAVFDHKELTIRARPSYFPFVEPGIEIDASCPLCTQGCSMCKKTGWIELMGAGLVHPQVLKMVNIDPAVYRGFAFGIGLERLIMLIHKLNDIRLLHSPKISFLDQF